MTCESALTRNERNLHSAVLATFPVIAVACYASVSRSFFLSDDFALLAQARAGGFSSVWQQAQEGLYRPVTMVTFVLDASIWRLDPLGFHATNIALHLLSGLLASLLSVQLLGQVSFPGVTNGQAALATGVVFLVLPSHAEAVSWISGRTDVVSTLLSLVSMVAYVSFLRTLRAPEIVLSLAACSLALFAKESALVLPMLIVTLSLLLPLEGRFRASRAVAVKAAAGFVVVLLAYLVVRSLVIGSVVGGYAGQRVVSFPHQFMKFAARAALPPLPVVPSQSPAVVAFLVASMALLVVFVVRTGRSTSLISELLHSRIWAIVACLFVVAALPIGNLGVSWVDTQGERFLYLPSVFVAMGITFLAARVIGNRRTWLGATTLLVLFYASSLVNSNRAWREAGQLSRRIVTDIAAAGGSQTVVVNVPDNIRGAYVYRNGLKDALDMTAAAEPRQLWIAGFHSVGSKDEPIAVEGDGGTLSVNLLTGSERFVGFGSLPVCAQFVSRSSSSLVIRASACPAEMTWLAFRNGRIGKLHISRD